MEYLLQELEIKIFKKRKSLNKLTDAGLHSKEVQKQSMDLDNLIDKYYKIKRINNKK